jgi:lysophospholipase L1-like esterase
MSTRSLLLLVGLVGGAELFARGHLAGSALAFQAGACVLALSLFVATRGRAAWLRLPALALAAAALLLAAAEWLPRAQPPTVAASTSFEEAHGNPEALRRWWEMHERERDVLSGRTPLAPGQRFSWFGGEIVLDERGLRALPAPADGAAYRIAVLGGSASFGTDQTPEEQPWPAALAAELDALYACKRPLAVSNAARPDRSLRSFSARYGLEVAPLEAKLVIVYAGADALAGLGPSAEALPATSAPERASRWLDRLERPYRERADARRLRDALAAETPVDLLRTSDTARDYRTLLVAARTAGTDVVLVPLALALDARSPEPVIRFHESVWPEARRLVVANREHARLLPLLGAAYRAPVIALGDDLDGAWRDAFLDLFHLSQAGSQRLARHVARGLAPLLTRPDPGCTPRPSAA